MKKILTLLIAVGAVATLHAQSREETRRVILGGSKDNGTYGGGNRDVILGGGNNNGQYPTYPNNGSYGGSRQAQVDQVNREYDAKIYSIRNNPNLTYAEKERMIRQLERDRQRRIDQISRQNNRYDNYDDRYERRDNGKHKGWYKGKGNPHRNGGKNWKNDRDRDDD